VMDATPTSQTGENGLRAGKARSKQQIDSKSFLPENITMNELTKLTTQHYEKNEAGGSLVSKVSQILDSLADGPLNSSQLAGLDQFHAMGLGATEQLAQIAGIERGAMILDAGSGLGGPSRYLASTYGCHVVGADLSPSFVAVAQLIAQLTGLSDLVSYQVGDLLALPFSNRSFDVVWTQHVVMNIPNRTQLYREFRRLLKPGGKLAFFDVLAADTNPELHFPVPWAESNETSFLLTPDETKSALVTAGFTIAAWNDVTVEVVQWFGQQRPPAQGFNLGIVMGPRFAEMTSNFARNIREERVRLVMAVCTADGTPS
jgi:sarcosine/dimethylglycine N-methyltransferase